MFFDFVKVRKKRIEKGFTQKQLSEKANVPIRTLEYLESGKHQTNNIILMNDIATALDCYLDDFVNDDIFLR